MNTQTDLEKLTAEVEELNTLLKEHFSYIVVFHDTAQRSYSSEAIAKAKVTRICELLGVKYDGLQPAVRNGMIKQG